MQVVSLVSNTFSVKNDDGKFLTRKSLSAGYSWGPAGMAYCFSSKAEAEQALSAVQALIAVQNG